MFLIPEDILENLICDACKKYLSVSPVKVYPNKEILCGRCSRDSDRGVVSLYDNIAQRGLFRCINRYDGCNEALLYSEVVIHESNCRSKLYDCPSCLWKMPSLFLINHFRECHKNNILRKSNISLKVDRFSVNDGKYLYIQDGFLFIICVYRNSSQIQLNTLLIGNEVLSKEIKQRFLLSSSDGALTRYMTEKQPCCKYEKVDFNGGFTIDINLNECDLNIDIDLETRKVQKLVLFPTLSNNNISNAPKREDRNILVEEHKLYIGEKFKNKWYPQYSLHSSGLFVLNVNNKILKHCSICRNKFHYFSSNQSIYKCTGCNLGCGTFVCSKCYFFGIKKCGEKNYEFAPEETTVAKDMQYFCRWDCGGKYFSWELKDHEYSCDYQLTRICPVENCKWTGKLFELKDHVNGHGNTIFYENHSFPLRHVKTISFILKNELIIPVSNYFISVKWKKTINNYYIFSLSTKDNCKKGLIAIISNNGQVEVFTNYFVFEVEGAPLLLITLRDL